MPSHVRRFLFPEASRGSNAAGRSALNRAIFASGKFTGMTSSVDETQLHRIVNLDEDDYPMLWLEEYQDSEGGVCTTLSISQSTDQEIAASSGMNAARIISDKIELQYEEVNGETENTKAATKLKGFLKDVCKMKMDERCVKGDRYTPGWENRGLRFYFKGRASDITLKQKSVEPADPPQPDTEDDESDDKSD